MKSWYEQELWLQSESWWSLYNVKAVNKTDRNAFVKRKVWYTITVMTTMLMTSLLLLNHIIVAHPRDKVHAVEVSAPRAVRVLCRKQHGQPKPKQRKHHPKHNQRQHMLTCSLPRVECMPRQKTQPATKRSTCVMVKLDNPRMSGSNEKSSRKGVTRCSAATWDNLRMPNTKPPIWA